MTRVEINALVENTNNKLIKAGKMFRVKTVNLIEHTCIFCNNLVYMEQYTNMNPICEKCTERCVHEAHIDDIDYEG